MDREEAFKHKKKKPKSTLAAVWAFIFAVVAVVIALAFSLLGFLFLYRVDAQNIAMKENDLEDTEWLTTKRLRRMKEFTVTTWNGVKEHDDEIVIGAEKKKNGVEIISTSQLHALIVGTTVAARRRVSSIRTSRS